MLIQQRFTQLQILYFSLIHPYLQYCLPIFGATYDTHLQPLRVLQKRAIRIISNSSFLEHTTPIFSRLKILKFDDLYKHSLAFYAYNHPHILNEHSRSHNYSTRNRESLIEPFHRLRSTNQSVILNTIRIWNEISEDVKQCRSYNSFKNQYKNELLKNYNRDSLQFFF